MTASRPKRPRDPAQLAKLIVDIATGEVEEGKVVDAPIHVNVRGAIARAAALSPERRSEIARDAATKRWKGKGPS